MPAKNTLKAIPIIDAHSAQRVGGFCASLDAVTTAELSALHHLRALHSEADVIKSRLAATPDPAAREAMQQRLITLRQDAAHWRQIREQATQEKHVALGHATLPALPILEPHPKRNYSPPLQEKLGHESLCQGFAPNPTRTPS
ncbi:MAG: hypothetical protein HQL63_04265 [Magnetococcales bacterium]|nr:hypothetical protein [Magnetococcales bacterium]